MPDGSKMYKTESKGAIMDAKDIGRKAGEKLKAEAGDSFFEMMVEVCF